ncbi:MAG: hypothetical protein KGN02_01475 [bacterium]|nr:hypothetical protein [bacterium]
MAGAYEKNAASDSPGADLAMWMHAHLKTYRGIVAIDDLHVAQEDREVTRFLAALIERTKGRVQWIIASRTALGLPIGTWLAYGESDLAIDEHDLKFSFDEARDAAKTFRLGVRDEELYELLNLTDGWATAMSFALRSSTRSVDLRNISSMTREMIYRYLAEQVYQGLNEEEREFLETAALLPEVEIDVLAAAGYERAVGAIEDLRQRVAFIQETERGDLYRLHDLFRDFVLYQLRLRGGDVLRSRAILLGTVLESTGRVSSALRLYVENYAPDDALRVLEAHGVALISRGFADEVRSAALAPLWKSFDEQPVLVALQGLTDLARGDVRLGQGKARRALSSPLAHDFRVALTLQLAVAEAMQGSPPITLLEALLEDSTLSDEARVESLALLAVCYTRAGTNERAAAILVDVIQSERSLQSDEARARVALRIGTVHFALRDYERARRSLMDAAELSRTHALWGIAAKTYFNLSLLALFSDTDASMSLWYAQQAAASATRAGEYLELQGALTMILSLETRRGNAERAVQVERQLADLRIEDSQRTNFIASSQAHRFAWQGKFADAHRLFGAILDRQVHLSDRLLVRASYALCLSLDGMTKQSGVVVEQSVPLSVEDSSENASNAVLTTIAIVMLALAELVAGRNTSAQRILKRFEDPGHPVLRHLRSAVDELVRMAKNPTYLGGDLSGDLAAIREAGFGGYAYYIIHVAEHLDRARKQETTVTLTPSEVRIIRDLAAGLTPKEIASEMGRSVYTVQTHIQNLMEKLGCHGRSEAIAAARRLGYIEAAR